MTNHKWPPIPPPGDHVYTDKYKKMIEHNLGGMAQQGLSAQNAQREPTLVERIQGLFKRHDSVRRQQDAYDEVLSYIQAQINIEPFKSNPLASQIFNRAMVAAVDVIAKGSI